MKFEIQRKIRVNFSVEFWEFCQIHSFFSFDGKWEKLYAARNPLEHREIKEKRTTTSIKFQSWLRGRHRHPSSYVLWFFKMKGLKFSVVCTYIIRRERREWERTVEKEQQLEIRKWWTMEARARRIFNYFLFFVLSSRISQPEKSRTQTHHSPAAFNFSEVSFITYSNINMSFQ